MEMATPSAPEPLLKEVLEAIKALQLSQTQLSSTVDAISGRVNVLAGMKEVLDAAASAPSTPPTKAAPSSSKSDKGDGDEDVPESPSLPPAQMIDAGGVVSTAHKRSPSAATTRIILT